MSTVGYSTLDIIPSVKNFRSQIERQTSGDLAAAGKKGGQQFGDAAGTAAGKQFKTKFSTLAKDVAAPVAGIFAGAAVVGLFKDAISGASDLAESGNKVKVIFGDATGEVEAFASKGAKALGQTRLEVLNAAATFGGFGKAAGLSGDELAGFSTKLAGLSTDLASFFNTDPSQAVEAIGSALRGEAEPIRAYNVLLDDATLRQEALRQGLIETTKQALTPQQKVLASYQVILKQTADAQGDFGDTSDGLANQQRILSAQWREMKTDLGSKLLPAVTAVTKEFNDGVLPAMSGVGGVTADAARAFGGLPGPVKAATGALVAFKAAQALGITSKMAEGAEAAGKAYGFAAQRVNFARAAFDNARSTVFQFGNAGGQASGQVSRLSASLAGLRAASFGAGAGLKRGLSGVTALVGGPWGAAFIAGTALVAHFWAEHQKAKQRVEDFTATLDKETGALTASSREFAAKALLDAGVLASSERLGVSLDLVTDAALNQKGAMAALTAQIASKGQLDDGAAADAIKLKGAIEDQNGVVQSSIANQKLFGAAVGDSADATRTAAGTTAAATGTMRNYASEIAAARGEVQKLLDKENERRNRNLGAFQDRTRLAQALRDARKEAREGARTLDEGKEAGLANRDALASLAGAWNDAANSVKNAKGAYADMRQNFIDVATAMGASKGEAKKLADQLLGIPPKTPAQVTTPGMDAALDKIRELNRELRTSQRLSRIVISAQASNNQAALTDIHRANGGPIRGPGTGTSDSILLWGSNGEFMQRKAAVDYYGEDFMRRLNNLQVPKFAGGGLLGGTTTTVHNAGVTVAVEKVVAQDVNDFLSQLQVRARNAGIGGVPQ